MATLSPLFVGRTSTGYCLRLTGGLTSRLSPAVLGLLIVQAVDDEDCVVVDLSDCEHLDPRLLDELVDLHRHYGHGDPPRFSVAATPDAYLRLFPDGLHDGLALHLERPETSGEDRPLPDLGVGTSDLNNYLTDCRRKFTEVRHSGRLEKALRSEPVLAMAGY